MQICTKLLASFATNLPLLPVLCLERDALSLVKRRRQETNEHAALPPPPRPPLALLPLLPWGSAIGKYVKGKKKVENHVYLNYSGESGPMEYAAVCMLLLGILCSREAQQEAAQL